MWNEWLLNLLIISWNRSKETKIELNFSIPICLLDKFFDQGKIKLKQYRCSKFSSQFQLKDFMPRYSTHYAAYNSPLSTTDECLACIIFKTNISLSEYFKITLQTTTSSCYYLKKPLMVTIHNSVQISLWSVTN